MHAMASLRPQEYQIMLRKQKDLDAAAAKVCWKL